MTALRTLAIAAAVWVLCGTTGTLTGLLAALPFHGTARFAVWAAIGVPTAAACGYLLDRVTNKEHQ